MNFTYDLRGNLIQVTDGADITDNTWDARDRLTGVSMPDGIAIAYEYDAAGRRVSQLVDGSEVNFLWDETSLYGDVILETDSFGAELASYVLGGSELLSQSRAGSTSYYLTDALGSIRGLTDDAGTISDTYDYTAFGELFASTGTTENRFLFTGQQFDSLTGQYYLRARYYQPGFGRFLSRDPLQVVADNPVELNRYVYTANNPPNLSDPSGLLAAEYAPTLTPSLINQGVITTIGRVALVSFAVGYISLLLAGEIDAPDRVGPSPLPDYIEDRIGDIVTQAEAADMARRLAELLETRPRPEPEPEEGPGPDIFPPIPPKPDDDKVTYVTYTLSNITTGEVYVGRSRGYGTPEQILASRYAGHHMRELGFRLPTVDRSAVATLPISQRWADPSYQAIRGREQQLIDALGGAWSDVGGRGEQGTRSGNAIRGVSKINPLGRVFHEASSANFGEAALYTGY